MILYFHLPNFDISNSALFSTWCFSTLILHRHSLDTFYSNTCCQFNIFVLSLTIHLIIPLIPGSHNSVFGAENAKGLYVPMAMRFQCTHRSRHDTQWNIYAHYCIYIMCNQMETFSVLLAFCAGNSLVTCGFPTQMPVTWSFDVFFDITWINPEAV